MEVLLQTESYSQSFSIMCMELCIKDVNEAAQNFLKKYHQIITFTNTPSWKFPHIDIHKLDILPIMEKYRNKTFTERQQYQELLELLIDRVCFSLLTTNKLLGTVLNNGNNGTTPVNSGLFGPHHQGQGDSAASPYKGKNASLSGISSVDSNTHPNVGILLKQLFDTVNAIQEARAVDVEKNRRKSNKPRFCSTSTQTSVLEEGCETCLVALNLLKFLATMITQVLSIFTESPSQIFKLRQDGESLWTLSQKEFLYEFCDAVQTDCKTLLEKASHVFEEKAAIQTGYDECKSNLDTETQKTINLNDEFNQKLQLTQDAVELERRRNHELEQHLLIQTSRSTDLQNELQNRMEEIGTLHEKIAGLTKSYNQINEWHKHLHETSSVVEKAKIALEEEVVSLKDNLHSAQNALENAETLVGLKDAEIDLLKSSLEKAKGDKLKKDEMKALLEKAKKQLEACKKVEDEAKRSKLADKFSMEKLKEKVANQQDQIELLTLYPDLNGPIFPPSAQDENPLHAMNNQVKSNQLRIQVLQSQTDRLKLTLDKCNGVGMGVVLGAYKSLSETRIQFST